MASTVEVTPEEGQVAFQLLMDIYRKRGFVVSKNLPRQIGNSAKQINADKSVVRSVMVKIGDGLFHEVRDNDPASKSERRLYHDEEYTLADDFGGH